MTIFLRDADGQPQVRKTLDDFVGSAGHLAVEDKPFSGEVPILVDQPYPPGRSLKVICTAAGVVEIVYVDGSTGIWPVEVGTQTLPLAVTRVVSAGTTATASFANLV